MKQAYFLTGTDTEIGKTFITCALLHRAQADNLRVAGLKPVAAGTNEAGLNDDVENIRSASNVQLATATINPYRFKPAIAPHIAAAEAGIRIDFRVIRNACLQAAVNLDFLIVEGVGGFRVPLGDNRDTADLAVELNLPVILVVGLRLGCINHALLTVEAIRARGLQLAGWVANCIDPGMARQEENLATLKLNIDAPLLGIVPFLSNNSAPEAAGYLSLPTAV
jgi:dethiobiotin synthetase